ILFVAISYLREGLKDAFEKNIKQLEVARDNFKEQRDSLIQISLQIRNIIDKKMKRIETLRGKEIITRNEFVEALNPDEQVWLILQSIYEFFQYKLPVRNPIATLRIGLYLRDEIRQVLQPAFSWDGKTKHCMSDNSTQMALASPNGVFSVIVQCYNSKEDPAIIIVSDCEKDPGFDFFRPQQKQYLKSMLAFKYKTEHDGITDALVLALDCNVINFFNLKQADELKAFLIEMMKRIDYELLSAEVSIKVH
ncbi:MAG: hypothetical protein K8R65_08010, partial [Nitrospirae bacterium]|nr:hypothetical protein [Nitrospirota bacterium]